MVPSKSPRVSTRTARLPDDRARLSLRRAEGRGRRAKTTRSPVCSTRAGRVVFADRDGGRRRQAKALAHAECYQPCSLKLTDLRKRRDACVALRVDIETKSVYDASDVHFRFLRRTAALIPGVVFFATGVGARAAPSDPARFVATIYADGRESAVWDQWLDGARRAEWFSRAGGAMGAVRRPRSQDQRRTRRAGFRHRDQFAVNGSQDVYGQDALAKRLARERCREAPARQLGAQIGSRERDPV